MANKQECPDEDLAPLARSIRQMRRETGLSVREFATAAGFPSHTTYAYYESPDFTGDEVRKSPRNRIAIVLLKQGIAHDRVAKLGKLPEEFSQTKADIEALRRSMQDLREEMAEMKRPRHRQNNG